MSREATLARFPFYYPKSAQYLVNGVASGAAGGVARLTISVNNWPQVATAIRVAHTYQIDDAVFNAVPTIYRDLAPVDNMATISITLAQQNITAEPVLLQNLQGRDGVVYHPLPTDYLWRGGNQITLELRRVVGYPVVSETNIIPTVHAALVVVVGVSDQLPGSAPGSTSRP